MFYDDVIIDYVWTFFGQELVTFDPTKSADLVRIHFAEEVQQIISKLQVQGKTRGR